MRQVRAFAFPFSLMDNIILRTFCVGRERIFHHHSGHESFKDFGRFDWGSRTRFGRGRNRRGRRHKRYHHRRILSAAALGGGLMLADRQGQGAGKAFIITSVVEKRARILTRVGLDAFVEALLPLILLELVVLLLGFVVLDVWIP